MNYEIIFTLAREYHLLLPSEGRGECASSNLLDAVLRTPKDIRVVFQLFNLARSSQQMCAPNIAEFERLIGDFVTQRSATQQEHPAICILWKHRSRIALDEWKGDRITLREYIKELLTQLRR